MTDIVDLKKDNIIVYPKTHINAIVNYEKIIRSSATIDTNKTEVTVQHNLGNVTSEMIMILPRSIITTNYRVAWVDGNSFRIVLNVAPSSGNIIFTWWVIK